jgi:hypothetical protein
MQTIPKTKLQWMENVLKVTSVESCLNFVKKDLWSSLSWLVVMQPHHIVQVLFIFLKLTGLRCLLISQIYLRLQKKKFSNSLNAQE